MNWLEIAAGTAAAWLLGLGAALTIRYAILRRPAEKWAAGLTAAAIWLCLFALFYSAWVSVDETDTFSQRAHVGLLLVAMAAYYVLVQKSSQISDENALAASDEVQSPAPEGGPSLWSRRRMRLAGLGILFSVVGFVIGLAIGLTNRDPFERRYIACMQQMGWQADIQVSSAEVWPSVLTQQRRQRCLDIAR